VTVRRLPGTQSVDRVAGSRTVFVTLCVEIVDHVDVTVRRLSARAGNGVFFVHMSQMQPRKIDGYVVTICRGEVGSGVCVTVNPAWPSDGVRIQVGPVPFQNVFRTWTELSAGPTGVWSCVPQRVRL
jgi:hypothetical protein